MLALFNPNASSSVYLAVLNMQGFTIDMCPRHHVESNQTRLQISFTPAVERGAANGLPFQDKHKTYGDTTPYNRRARAITAEGRKQKGSEGCVRSLT